MGKNYVFAEDLSPQDIEADVASQKLRLRRSAGTLPLNAADKVLVRQGTNLVEVPASGFGGLPPYTAAAAASSVSATVPAGAVEGDIWHTTLSTTAPYAKASTYAFLGGKWVFISGYANAEVSVAVNVSGIGTPVSQAVDTSTLVINTLNTSSTVNTITIPADGVYETHIQLNPGTACTSSSNVGQFGYGLRIFANGSEVFSNFTPLNALNTLGYSGGAWGAAMQCSNTTFFYAGTTISFEIYASNCTIVGGANARVSLRSRGGF